MIFKETKIEGLIIIEPNVFEDDRGHFFESYNKNEFVKNGIDTNFIQDNQSLSQRSVLRGLHFQAPPFAQSKLIRVINGSVLDVAVDIRKNSLTYGKHESILLSSDNKKMFFIPEGFAHGFLTLENNTIFSYKCSNFYNTLAEGSILWNDKSLNINWNFESPLLSEKDKNAQNFNKFISPF
jgi:dTDP-4-dehydrorhamnose 3,5-epimerase